MPPPKQLSCSSGDGSGLLPELLRAAGHPAAASGDAWYLRRWPWILLLTALATPAVSGKPCPVCLPLRICMQLCAIISPAAVMTPPSRLPSHASVLCISD
jgi:hypothetical protein